jgi:hypothetical protein
MFRPKVVKNAAWLRAHVTEKLVHPELGVCWEWEHAVNRGGYGVTSMSENNKRHSRLVHRVSWTLHVGAIPSTMCVLHKCDNRKCCNPAHLFLGTYADNVADMEAKGRGVHPKGEAHVATTLTEDNVRELRKRWNTETHRALAAEFGVPYQTAYGVVTGKAWKHVKLDEHFVPLKEHLNRQGEANNKAKLTDAAVRMLRARWNSEPHRALALEYNISLSTAERVASGKGWAHIPLDENFIPQKEYCGVRGEEHPKAKLSENDVREIRRRWVPNCWGLKLAEEFGVTKAAIKAIVRRLAWRHLE